MKKNILIIALFVVLSFMLSGCGSNDNEYLKDISYKELNEKIENKDSFILEVVQTGCSNCTAFTPKFKSVLEDYEITAYQMNITNLSESDSKKFLDDYDVDGTPTILFFVDGKDSGKMKRLEGNQDKSVIISKLTKAGYIKED